MVGVLISGAWGNVYVFAQHSSLPWSPPASLQQSSSGDDGNNMPGWTTLTTAASKPQLLATSQQQQQRQLLNNNGTQIQDYTFNSPDVAQDKLMYLGYHGIGANNDHSPPPKTSTSTSDTDHSSSSKDKYKPDSHHTIRESSIGNSKSPAHHSSSISHKTPIGKATNSKSETNYKDIKPCIHNKSFPRETLEPKNNRYSNCNDHMGEDGFFGRDTFFNADTFSDNNF